jgi:hypothetical protein
MTMQNVTYGAEREEPHWVAFVFFEIDSDDHDTKTRLNAFSYDAAEFSYDEIRYDAMIMIKF